MLNLNNGRTARGKTTHTRRRNRPRVSPALLTLVLMFAFGGCNCDNGLDCGPNLEFNCGLDLDFTGTGGGFTGTSTSSGFGGDPNSCPDSVAPPTIVDLGPEHARLIYTASTLTTELEIYLVDDREPARLLFNATPSAVNGSFDVEVNALPPGTALRAVATAGCASGETAFETTAPAWPDVYACPTGASSTVIFPMDGSLAGWTSSSDNGSSDTVSAAVESHPQLGAVTTFDFSLDAGSWVTASSQSGPNVDLSSHSHLCVPVAGNAANPDVALQLRLRGQSTLDPNQIAVAAKRVESLTDLPDFRGWIIDLRELEPQGSEPLDLSQVNAVEVSFACNPSDGDVSSCPGQPGAVPLGTPGQVQLGPISALLLEEVIEPVDHIEPVAHRELPMRQISEDLRIRSSIESTGEEVCGPLVADWFGLPETPQPPARYSAYSQALTLLVMAKEYERTCNDETCFLQMASAAADLASQLLALQHQGAPNTNAEAPLIEGLWCDTFTSPACGSYEAAADCTRGTGSSAWIGMALLAAHDLLPEGQEGTYDAAIQLAVNAYGMLAGSWQPGAPEGSVASATSDNLIVALFLAAAAERGFISSENPELLTNLSNYLEGLVDPQSERLRCGPGPYDYGGCLDATATLGAAWWLRNENLQRALSGMAYGETLFRTHSIDQSTIGLSDALGPWVVSGEHIGQWASVGAPAGNYLLQRYLETQTDTLQVDGFPRLLVRGASDDFSAGTSENTRWYGVAPAAWAYFAMLGDQQILLMPLP